MLRTAVLLLLLFGLALQVRPERDVSARPAAETETEQYRPVGLPAAAAARPTEARFASPLDGPTGGPRAADAFGRDAAPAPAPGAILRDRVEERRTAAVPRFRAHRAPRC